MQEFSRDIRDYAEADIALKWVAAGTARNGRPLQTEARSTLQAPSAVTVSVTRRAPECDIRRLAVVVQDDASPEVPGRGGIVERVKADSVEVGAGWLEGPEVVHRLGWVERVHTVEPASSVQVRYQRCGISDLVDVQDRVSTALGVRGFL